MSSSIVSPFPIFNDLDGTPLENGYIYIGASNLNPETSPVNVFWDAARTIPAPQPIRTIGGFPSRNGSPSNVYVEADTYSITVRNSNRVLVYNSAATGTPTFQGYPVNGSDVNFLQAGTGAVARNMQDKAREIVSVKDFGAVGDGVHDDTAAVTSSLSSGNAYFRNGSYKVSNYPTFTGPKVFEVDSSATVSGTGIDLLGLLSNGIGKKQILQLNTSGGDVATQYVRRIANHSGGTPGWVSTAVNARIDVTNPDATNFEWAILGVVDNSATAGENVGGYFQGIKRSTGPTWGATIEVIDKTGANPTTGAVAVEIDVTGNGTDNNNNRVGIDIACRKDDAGGSGCVAGFGIRLQNQSGSGYTVGFDTSSATIYQSAIRIGQGQVIAFDGNATDKVASDGTGIVYYSGGAFKAKLVNDGGIYLTSRTKIAGTFSTGSQTPTMGTNKPGSTGGAPATWLSVVIDGVQHWVPAWVN